MNTQIGYTGNVIQYLDRLYQDSKKRFACHANTPEEVTEWQQKARPALRRLIGIEQIRSKF